MASIKIETGVKVFDIEDEFGNIRGQIKFNPQDLNLFVRASKFCENVERYLSDITTANEGLSDADLAKEFEKYNNIVREELNDVFGDPNVSDVVFGVQSCFNMINGKTFVERFLEAIMPIIEEGVGQAAKESEKKVSSYLDQLGDK